jgi:hypothetical protein
MIYRSGPAFQIVPVDDKGSASILLADDTLSRAEAVGSSDVCALSSARKPSFR